MRTRTAVRSGVRCGQKTARRKMHASHTTTKNNRAPPQSEKSHRHRDELRLINNDDRKLHTRLFSSLMSGVRISLPTGFRILKQLATSQSERQPFTKANPFLKDQSIRRAERLIFRIERHANEFPCWNGKPLGSSDLFQHFSILISYLPYPMTVSPSLWSGSLTSCGQ